MLDIVHIPDETTVECEFEELPDFLLEKVKIHFPQDEKPIICAVTKHFDTVWVQVISSYRIVSSSFMVKKEDITFKSPNESASMLISGFAGFSFDESGKPRRYDLNVISPSVNLSLKFFDKEVLKKFADLILSLINKSNR